MRLLSCEPCCWAARAAATSQVRQVLHTQRGRDHPKPGRPGAAAAFQVRCAAATFRACCLSLGRRALRNQRARRLPPARGPGHVLSSVSRHRGPRHRALTPLPVRARRDYGGKRSFAGPAHTIKCFENNPLVRKVRQQLAPPPPCRGPNGSIQTSCESLGRGRSGWPASAPPARRRAHPRPAAHRPRVPPISRAALTKETAARAPPGGDQPGQRARAGGGRRRVHALRAPGGHAG